MTNTARYLGLIIATFPELRERLSDEDGMYLKTHVFVDFANSAIAKGDWETLKKVYSLVDRILKSDPDEEVYNIVYVAFIEHLKFHADPINGPKAKKLLPPRLLQAWQELEKYWREASKKKRRRSSK